MYRLDRSGNYYTLATKDPMKESDKDALKFILQQLYPTEYEKPYNQAIGELAKAYGAPDVTGTYDNKDFRVRRLNGGLLIVAY